jgi:hypothetical protein
MVMVNMTALGQGYKYLQGRFDMVLLAYHSSARLRARTLSRRWLA